MILTDVWGLYKADKQIQGYSPQTLKAYYVQFNLLVNSFGEYIHSRTQLILLKFIWEKQLKSLSHPVWVTEFDLLNLYLDGLRMKI
jgi:hypothetical protein